jgi:hypothetical protein
MESGQQFFHVFGSEIAEAIVFEVNIENIVPPGLAGAQEILDQLIEKIGFAGPAGADDGKDRTGGGEIRAKPLARSQGRELGTEDPLGDNPR